LPIFCQRVDYLLALFDALPQQAEKGQHFFHQRQLQIKALIEQSDDNLKNILVPLPPTDPLVTIFRPILNTYEQQIQQHPKAPHSIHHLYFVKPVYDVIVFLQRTNTIGADLLYIKQLTGQALNVFDEVPEQNKVLSEDIAKTTLKPAENAYNHLKEFTDRIASEEATQSV
jgi:hypothetical protein